MYKERKGWDVGGGRPRQVVRERDVYRLRFSIKREPSRLTQVLLAFALYLLSLSPSHVCVSVRARCVFGADI